jgi:hypothetical protein
VTAVADPAAADQSYIVSFDRSVTGCVVQGVPGFGDPGGAGSGADYAMPLVGMYMGGAKQVGVRFHDETGTQVDTGFLITAFC